MHHSKAFWQRQGRTLDRAFKAFRQGSPEGAGELETAVEQIAAASGASRDRVLARRARRIARLLGKVRAVDSQREMLSRVRQLGLLSPESATGLDARWEDRSRDARERALREMQGKALRRLRNAVARTRGPGARRLAKALARAHRRAARRLEALAGDVRARDLLAYRRAALIAQALEAAAPPSPAGPGEPNGRLEVALERWRALRAFRRRLRKEQDHAEHRGAVTLTLDLDRLLTALRGAVAEARRKVAAASRAPANVVSFQRRSA